MEFPHQTGSNFQLPVHPSQITKPEWILSKEVIYTPGLAVEHRKAEPDELEPPPLSQHLFPVFFSDGTQHTTRIESDSFEGQQRAGDVWPNLVMFALYTKHE